MAEAIVKDHRCAVGRKSVDSYTWPRTTCHLGDKRFSLTGPLFAPSGRMTLEPNPAARRRRADAQETEFLEKTRFLERLLPLRGPEVKPGAVASAERVNNNGTRKSDNY